jgi:putative two-component system response regulator
MAFFVKEKKKILLVDDSEIDLAFTQLLLQNKYTVVSAKSGKEALDHLLRGPVPDLVLLDLIMPSMDGWETFNRIKAITCLKGVPIAFLTIEHGITEQNHAREIGAVDYIFKPYKRKDLLKRIKVILKRNPVKEQGS